MECLIGIAMPTARRPTQNMHARNSSRSWLLRDGSNGERERGATAGETFPALWLQFIFARRARQPRPLLELRLFPLFPAHAIPLLRFCANLHGLLCPPRSGCTANRSRARRTKNCQAPASSNSTLRVFDLDAPRLGRSAACNLKPDHLRFDRVSVPIAMR